MDDTYHQSPGAGYDNHALEFFYKKGKVYIELIYVLRKLCDVHKDLPSVEVIMNMAFDRLCLPAASRHKYPCSYLKRIREPYVRYAVAALLFQNNELRYDVQVAIEEMDTRDEFFPAFRHFFVIPNPARVRKERRSKDLEDQIKDLRNQITERDDFMQELFDKQKLLESRLENLSQSFSFERILQYAMEQGGYEYCNQILVMLKDLCNQDGASALCSQVTHTIHRMKEKKLQNVTKVINNHITNSNAFLGNVNNPTFNRRRKGKNSKNENPNKH